MKKFLPHLIIGILALALIVAGYKACNLYDELSVQKGKYAAYRAVAKADYAKAQAVIEEQSRVISKKDAEISISKHDIQAKNAQVAEKKRELAALEESYSKLSTDVLRIENLQQQVVGWKEQFSLAQGVIADQEKIIAAWEGKFNAQVKISDEYKAALDKQIALNVVANDLIKGLEGKVRGVRFGSKVKTVALVVAGGYIAYKLAK